MKLYFSPGSCALATHIALAESGLPYEIEAVNLRVDPHTTASGAVFTTINPKGYVPALVLDNGEILTEGQVLLQYVADQVPDKKLAPAAGTIARYRMMEWLSFISTEIHKAYKPLWMPTASMEAKDAAWAQLSRRFDYLNRELSDKDYLLGAFSAADCYLFVTLSWADNAVIKRSIDGWTNLSAFMKRMKERASVRKAMKEEGLL
ncbi:MAG: glutathione transferase GstA [Burkholderiales bacterium]|nr:glutathione transferase GstA [Burkholderiales bacterium]